MTVDPTYDLAFETVGNATVIVHDTKPVLATDPWLFGSAYFGSWILSHAIPEEQLASIRACPYLWISHGHPDHLSMPSLETLRDATILLADHVGGRIRDSLVKDGYRVRVLPDRQWVPLSPRVRVLSIADSYQDSILLIDLDGTLVINGNDCLDHGWSPFVRRVARKHDRPFLLALAGYGDADMINYFDDDGNRVPPRAALRLPPGRGVTARLKALGAGRYVPFATMHRYQREDSIWANEFTTPLEDLLLGFDSTAGEQLPAFVRYDCGTGAVTRLDPPANPIEPKPSTEFGDDWTDRLVDDDVRRIREYFTAITSLTDVLDTITLRVGGEDHEIRIGGATGRGVRFETPRGSLMSAVEWEIFDDLLIGNFTKTTLTGDWPTHSLRPDFTAHVAKYADNGRAFSNDEVDAYLAEYRRRGPLDYFEYQVLREYSLRVKALARTLRARVPAEAKVTDWGRSVYAKVRR